MTEPVWKASAIADLTEIIDYISDNNPVAAHALLADIEDKVARIVANPRSGRPGRVKGTRELVVRPNYIVIYAETHEALTVLRVLHAAQQWP